MVLSYADNLLCGVSFYSWLKRVLEGDQYDAVVLWLKNKNCVRGRGRIRQSLEEWISLLRGRRSVCA